jgi:CheY-like chemotaxis protein
MVVMATKLPDLPRRQKSLARKIMSEVKEAGLVSPMVYLGLTPAKATVLVVDDSPEMQRYFRLLLETDSYRVETASNGYEALRSLRRAIPQVVLLDLQMPGMDGLETLRRMQALRPQPKVIICSGVDDPVKILQAAALGAHSFLMKPIQHLYLSAALERCLNEGPAKRTAGHSGAQVFVLPSSSPL